MRYSVPFAVVSVAAAAVMLATVPATVEATVFRLTATDVVVDQPAPLFTSGTVSGILTLDDSIGPGQSFGTSSVTGLTLDFAGIKGNLSDIQAEIAPGPVQVFGTRSLDGAGFSVFDLRFGFPTSSPGCSFVCAGQIIINSPIGPNDPSNFIAIDDVAGTSLSVISSFTPMFSLVPEPSGWLLMIAGLGAVGAARRRRSAGAPER